MAVAKYHKIEKKEKRRQSKPSCVSIHRRLIMAGERKDLGLIIMSNGSRREKKASSQKDNEKSNPE